MASIMTGLFAADTCSNCHRALVVPGGRARYILPDGVVLCEDCWFEDAEARFAELERAAWREFAEDMKQLRGE